MKMRHDSAGESGNSTFLHIPPGRALCRLRRKGAEAVKKRSNFPDFVPENDDFAYQDGHPDDPQGDDPDEYDPNWADDDPVEVAGQADMFAHEDFWNASADDSEALPEEEKVYKHSIFKPEMKKPNFVLSIAVNVIRIFAVLVLVAGLAAVGAVVGIAKGYMETAPTLDLAAIDDQAQTSFIYDANGNLITEYKGSENRVIVSIQAMPTYLQHAFIAVEDARFYTHNGVDIKRIIGAFVSNLSSSSTQGGSTITQQLIKNTLLSSEQSYKRKIQEAYLAMQLETRYTKDQILESYLNTIYLGENYYGVYTAAQGYFGKSLGELTLRECAMLAGTCNSPYYYNPRRNFYTRQKEGVDYPAITNDRTNYVLRCMYENQYITYEQYQEALDPATAHVLEKDPNTATGMYAYAHYVEYAVDEVIDILLQLNNLEDTSANRNAMENKLRTGGYHVQLAIDTSIQSTVEDTLENWTNYPTLRDPADKVYRTRNSDGTYDETVEPQAAAVVVDYHTGEIKAIVGSRTRPTAMKTFNRAVDMTMPVGSSIKPIAVYAPAIELGASPASIVMNMPLPISGWRGSNGQDSWPRNYGGSSYAGPETLRKALVNSHNTAAAQALMTLVGVDNSVAFLHAMGIDDAHIDATPFGLSLGCCLRRAGERRRVSAAHLRPRHLGQHGQGHLGRPPAAGASPRVQRIHGVHGRGHAQAGGFLRHGHKRENQGADRRGQNWHELRPEGRFLRRHDGLLLLRPVGWARQLQGAVVEIHRLPLRRPAVAELHEQDSSGAVQPRHSGGQRQRLRLGEGDDVRGIGAACHRRLPQRRDGLRGRDGLLESRHRTDGFLPDAHDTDDLLRQRLARLPLLPGHGHTRRADDSVGTPAGLLHRHGI